MLCIRYLHRHPSELHGVSSRVLVDLGIVLLNDNEVVEKTRDEVRRAANNRGRR